MLDAKAPQREVGVKLALRFKETSISGAIEASKALNGIGAISRPRQDAVNIYCESLRVGSRACPPYIPFVAPKLGEDLWPL